MKRNRILFTAVLALLLVAAFAITALAEAMEGPDEVYEGDDVAINFNSPDGGGMEGSVSASDNLTFQGITTNNMGSSLSDENHVFSLFGDPVTYTYSVSAAAGDTVCVTLSDAEQSDAEGNLTTLDDQTWSRTVQAAGTATPGPSGNPSGQPSGNPSGNPTGDPSPSQTLGPIPSLPPSGQPSSIPGTPTDVNIVININNTNTNVNTNYVPVRYPAYAPRPAPQLKVYRSNDGMPKMGDEGSGVNYWALLTIGALLGVVVLVAATQLYSYRKNKPVNVTIVR